MYRIQFGQLMKLSQSKPFLQLRMMHVFDVGVVVPPPYTLPVDPGINFQSIQHHCHRSRSASRWLTLRYKLLNPSEKGFTVSLHHRFFEDAFPWVYPPLPSSLSRTIRSFGTSLRYTLWLFTAVPKRYLPSLAKYALGPIIVPEKNKYSNKLQTTENNFTKKVERKFLLKYNSCHNKSIWTKSRLFWLNIVLYTFIDVARKRRSPSLQGHHQPRLRRVAASYPTPAPTSLQLTTPSLPLSLAHSAPLPAAD